MVEPSYDSVWKALPDPVLLALIRLAAPDVTAILRPWKTDLKVLFNREIDDAFLVEIHERPVLLHLEFQNYPDPTMALRVFHYIAALKLQYYQIHQQDIPVVTIVIWVTTSPPPEPFYQSSGLADTGTTHRYRNLWLRDLDWQAVDPLLLVLAPYMRGVERTNVKDIAVQMYNAAPENSRQLLLGAFLILMRRTYKDSADLENDILQQVRTTMDLIYDIIANDEIGLRLKAEGEAKGEARGEAKGEARGEAKGEAKAITLLWQGRFGSVPAAVTAALGHATSEQLQHTLEAFAVNAAEADVRAALGVV